MSYTLVHDGHIAELRFSEPTNIAEYYDARNAVTRIHRDHGIQDVLVDLGQLAVKIDIGRYELLEFSRSWDKEVVKKIRFALVLPKNITNQGDFYFITYLSMRQGVPMMTFYDEYSAIRWLGVSDATFAARP